MCVCGLCVCACWQTIAGGHAVEDEEEARVLAAAEAAMDRIWDEEAGEDKAQAYSLKMFGLPLDDRDKIMSEMRAKLLEGYE